MSLLPRSRTPTAAVEKLTERAKSIEMPGYYHFRPTGTIMFAEAEELDSPVKSSLPTIWVPFLCRLCFSLARRSRNQFNDKALRLGSRKH